MEQEISPALIYNELKELAEKIGIPVREEATESMQCGLFTLKGKRQIFVNRADTFADRIEVLVSVLKKEELGDVYIMPRIRALLENE